MKLKKLLLALGGACLLASCDYLDKTPDEDMTIPDVFTNPDWTRAFCRIFTVGFPTKRISPTTEDSAALSQVVATKWRSPTAEPIRT